MKCTCCKKKSSELLMVKCSDCTAAFCITCRLPEVHACPAQVKKAVILPKVVAPKVEQI
jgi:predicted nucleic acid binding AN1-type Zn finger protein